MSLQGQIARDRRIEQMATGGVIGPSLYEPRYNGIGAGLPGPRWRPKRGSHRDRFRSEGSYLATIRRNIVAAGVLLG